LTIEKLTITLTERDIEIKTIDTNVMKYKEEYDIEKDLRMKSEHKEREERSERIATTAQLLATQTECK
jgi:hypothetical protein